MHLIDQSHRNLFRLTLSWCKLVVCSVPTCRKTVCRGVAAPSGAPGWCRSPCALPLDVASGTVSRSRGPSLLPYKPADVLPPRACYSRRRELIVAHPRGRTRGDMCVEGGRTHTRGQGGGLSRGSELGMVPWVIRVALAQRLFRAIPLTSVAVLLTTQGKRRTHHGRHSAGQRPRWPRGAGRGGGLSVIEVARLSGQSDNPNNRIPKKVDRNRRRISCSGTSRCRGEQQTSAACQTLATSLTETTS